MRNLLGLCSLLLAATTLTAQSPSTGSVLLLQQHISQNCPVGLSARHSSDGGMVSVSPGSGPHQQGYDITFSPRKSLQVAQARISLHGISGSHVIPAGKKEVGDATESFTVSPTSSANHRFQSVVYTAKLTGVEWVELNDLTYTDGTQWHESADAICRVAPNGYMLVASGN